MNIKHEFLSSMDYTFQTDERLYFVMPFIEGGELYRIFAEYKKFHEIIVKFYISQIVMGLGKLHEKGIMHRDLKPENVMMCKDGYLKLIDFGLAKALMPNELTSTYGGTAEYMAPELRKKPLSYNHTVDWWAVGVMAYEMAYGATPFFNRNRPKLNQNIVNVNYSFPSRIETSDEFKDFIRKLLVKDPSQRLGANGAEEVLAHPWFGTDEEKSAILNKEIGAPILPGENGEILEQYYDFKGVERESRVPTKKINQDAFAGFGGR